MFPPTRPLKAGLISPGLICSDLVFRVKVPFPQCAFLHHHEEDGHKNEDMNGGSNHAADDGRGYRLHHIGAYAGFPKNWY